MWLGLVLIILGLLYYILKRKYNYWKDRGVPGPDPTFLFGNIGPVLIGNKNMTELYADMYR